LDEGINMSLIKLTAVVAMGLSINMSMLADVNAASLSVKCLAASEAGNAKIVVRGTGLKGKYYVKVFSGKNTKQSEVKPALDGGVVDFKFDSDPEAVNAGAIEIPADFIKKRRVVGVIRKAGTHARIGGVISTCIARQPKAAVSP
jgi:hypothetical protein